MAEANSSEVLTESAAYYCHKCFVQIVPQLPDYICPRCLGGFIEPVTEMSNSSSSSSSDASTTAARPGSSQDNFLEMDSDEHSNNSSFDSMDDMDWNSISNIFLSRGPLSSFILGANAPDEVMGGSSSGGPTSSNPSENSSSAAGSSSSGPGGRRNSSRRVLNALLMGTPNRRSRLRGPERFQTLAPMLQDLIVHISTGGPMGLFTEELASNPGDYAWGRGGLDSVITQLLNQMEGNGPPPLSQEQIEAIPSIKVNQKQINSKAQCSVCMDDFVLEESVKQLNCEHCFHEPCITPWLKMHATCPVCRKSLNDSGADTASTQTGGSSSSSINPSSSTPLNVTSTASRMVMEPSSTTTFIITSGPSTAAAHQPSPRGATEDSALMEEDLD